MESSTPATDLIELESPAPAPEFIKAEPPKQSFRARLGAKFKLMLEWMRERLFFFLRQ
ncbi:MAG TPA: hypothetical protein VG324_24555 [Blastocatellia bacterium]|nr:hypothetical protein [Blastocatellia bacterium]